MIKNIDLTANQSAAYQLAKVISRDYYKDILYYEFHKHRNPESGVYESRSLDEFREYSEKYYDNFICSSYPDEFEAIIEIAVKLGDQWFTSFECGSNFYFGFGPQGIIELRKVCTEKNIPIIVVDEPFDSWLEQNFNDKENNSEINSVNEYERVIKAIKHMFRDFERRPIEYKNINEESIRDRLLAPINGATQGRAHAEAKNVKGKTDILIKTEDGLNEFIFELKIWHGIGSLEKAINQLSGYINCNNERCGLLILSYNSDFKNVLATAKTHIESRFDLIKNNLSDDKELKFRMSNPIDSKEVEVSLLFVNLFC